MGRKPREKLTWAGSISKLAEALGLPYRTVYEVTRVAGAPQRTNKGFSVEAWKVYVKKNRIGERQRQTLQSVDDKDRKLKLEVAMLQLEYDEARRAVVRTEVMLQTAEEVAGLVIREVDLWQQRVIQGTRNPEITRQAKNLHRDLRERLEAAILRLQEKHKEIDTGDSE